ncbi:lysophospholipid acyltransferase family protein [Hymenobacter jejuensis]|uniref:lysophospholipid acyltransferase family protein n=1 Tax=Hymenobacter jejuensis TaxID=2502781 RepID=UPI001E5A0EA8|nr:lysophospholipid acyltransferase family protein [Hymenobacter jejuensis]
MSTISKPYPWYYRPLEWLLVALASLPLSVLYVIADGVYLLVAYVVRYRWRVVTENLRNSFPEKNETEIAALARGFYRHFSQILVEILKLRTISHAELQRRVRMRNPEVMTDLFDQGRTVLAMGSHAGNWEWILSAGAFWFPDKADGVYKPLSNPFFEDFMYRLRTRTGARMVPMRDTLRDLVRRRNEVRSLSLLSDQAAGPEDQPYWTTFLHQDTSFYTGADKLAAQFHYPVVYVGIRRVRRGYYEVWLAPLYDGNSPLDKNDFVLAEKFARQLELDIQAAPTEYLWSHRRWKHKRTPKPAV